MKDIILNELNELGEQLEESYGKKLILMEEEDFEEFADKLVKKLKQEKHEPKPELDLSNGATVYCTIDNEEGFCYGSIIDGMIHVAWTSGTNSRIKVEYLSNTLLNTDKEDRPKEINTREEFLNELNKVDVNVADWAYDLIKSIKTASAHIRMDGRLSVHDTNGGAMDSSLKEEMKDWCTYFGWN